MEAPNYYQLLGVSSRADTQQIRQAYHRLARQHHPDVNPGDVRSAAMMTLLNEAVAVLSDEGRRAVYDRSLGDGHAARGAAPAHAPSRYDGHDVEYRVTITAAEARRGTRREASFHRPDGTPYCIAIEIPPGTIDGTQIRLAGHGGPGLHGGRRGDLCVRVLVQ
jgi:curved DNA-binding protein